MISCVFLEIDVDGQTVGLECAELQERVPGPAIFHLSTCTECEGKEGISALGYG